MIIILFFMINKTNLNSFIILQFLQMAEENISEFPLEKMDEYAEFLVESHYILIDWKKCQEYFPETSVSKDWDHPNREYNFHHNRYLKNVGSPAKFFFNTSWGINSENNLASVSKKKFSESMLLEFVLLENLGCPYLFYDDQNLLEFETVEGKEISILSKIWLKLDKDKKILFYEKFIQPNINQFKLQNLSSKFMRNRLDEIMKPKE